MVVKWRDVAASLVKYFDPDANPNTSTRLVELHGIICRCSSRLIDYADPTYTSTRHMVIRSNMEAIGVARTALGCLREIDALLGRPTNIRYRQLSSGEGKFC